MCHFHNHHLRSQEINAILHSHSRTWTPRFWSVAVWCQNASKQSSVLSDHLFCVFSSSPTPNISPLGWWCDIWILNDALRQTQRGLCKVLEVWQPVGANAGHSYQTKWCWDTRFSGCKAVCQQGFFLFFFSLLLFFPRHRPWNGQKLGPRISAWTDSATGPIS